MATMLVKKEAPQRLDLAESWIPAPGPRLRRWLVGGLVAWQIALFWIVPCWLLWRGPSEGDVELSTFIAFEIIYVEDICNLGAESIVALSLALAGNLGIYLAKSPQGIVARWICLLAIFWAAQAGALFTHFGSWDPGGSAFLILVTGGVLMATALGWRLFPGLRSLRVHHLEDETPDSPAAAGQIRLVHLFFLTGAIALLFAVIRRPPPLEVFMYSFHEPVEMALWGGLLIVVTSILSAAVQRIALAPDWRVWLLLPLAALVAPLAMGVSYLNEGIMGHRWDIEFFYIWLRIYSLAFALLAGYGLAFRWLGYRLLRAPSAAHAAHAQ